MPECGLAALSHTLRAPLTGIRGFAELMGGRLTVSSAPGQGSGFTLALPLA